MSPTNATIFVTACGDRQFHCPEGYCIPASWTCDRIVDCKNADDERNCCKRSSLSSSLCPCSYVFLVC